MAMVALAPQPPSAPTWWRKPGGSIHAVEAPHFRTVCGRFIWTAAWTRDENDDPEERCPVCVALLTPTESELRELHGGR